MVLGASTAFRFRCVFFVESLASDSVGMTASGRFCGVLFSEHGCGDYVVLWIYSTPSMLRAISNPFLPKRHSTPIINTNAVLVLFESTDGVDRRHGA